MESLFVNSAEDQETAYNFAVNDKWPCLSDGAQWSGCKTKVTEENGVITQFSYCVLLPSGKVFQCTEKSCEEKTQMRETSKHDTVNHDKNSEEHVSQVQTSSDGSFIVNKDASSSVTIGNQTY